MIKFRESSELTRPTAVILLAVLLVLSVGVNLYFLLGKSRGETVSPQAGQKWTCGMHPQVIQDKPGTCPICGMNLTPMNASSGAMSGENTIQIDPRVSQNIGLKTVLVERRNLTRTVRTSGKVAIDESRTVAINLKYMGWVETLFADKSGQFVQEGDPLFDIFSPDLLNAQDAYIIARTNSPATVGVARGRLINYGMTEEQIATLDGRQEAPELTTVNSPVSGFLLKKNIVEGGAVMAGQDVLVISAIDQVWVLAQVYDYELPWVKTGGAARVNLDALVEQVHSTVSFIYPTIDPETRAAQVRISVANSTGVLKPDMAAQVFLTGDTLLRVLAVPRDAVVRSGKRDLAFVMHGEGKIEPRQVTLGLEADDFMYEVESGLREGEPVVTNAAFLLDSETQLQEALRKMSGQSESLISTIPAEMRPDVPSTNSPPAANRSRESKPDTARTQSAPESGSLKEAADATMDELFLQAQLFMCPTHHEVVDEQKGTSCPLCKTALTALDSLEVVALRDAQPYGCVMCPIVVPGSKRDMRCPICNMKLTAIENPKR